MQLYGLYTECEAIYQVDQLMTVHESLDAADRAAFNIDPRSIEWPTYIRTVHLPSIVHHSRAKTTPGKSRNDRADRLRRGVLSPDRHMAAFDLENTLMDADGVLEAAVIAVPDDRWSERPLAAVVREAGSEVTAEQLRDNLSQHLARWQLPERWAFIDEVPKTSVGKFDKKVLRKQYADGELDVQELAPPPS